MKAISIALFIIAAIIIVIFVIPMVVFFADFTSNPKLFTISSSVTTNSSQNIKVDITLSYDGHIYLTDVYLKAFVRNNYYTAYTPRMSGGDNLTMTLFIPIEQATSLNISKIEISFKVMGIYPLTIGLTPSS